MKIRMGMLGGLVLGAVFTQGVACDESINDVENRIDCAQYCDQAAECDSDVDVDECRDTCREQLDNCMVDELDEAQDQLDECSDVSCDDFTSCTIEAGAQCYFGL